MTNTVPTATHDEMRRMLLEEIAIRDRVIMALQQELMGWRRSRFFADPTIPAHMQSLEMLDLYRKQCDDLQATRGDYSCSAFTGHTIDSAPKALRNGYAICVNADAFPGSIECVVTFTNADAKVDE
jgi:hypothetical protein